MMSVRDSVVSAIANLCYLSTVAMEPVFDIDSSDPEGAELDSTVRDAFDYLCVFDRARDIAAHLNNLGVTKDEFHQGVNWFIEDPANHNKTLDASSFLSCLQKLYGLNVAN